MLLISNLVGLEHETVSHFQPLSPLKILKGNKNPGGRKEPGGEDPSQGAACERWPSGQDQIRNADTRPLLKTLDAFQGTQIGPLGQTTCF